MSKQIGAKGLALVKEFEGCYLEAYQDIVKVWTIGYGHTGKVDGKEICKGMKITQEKATKLLISDLQSHADYVDNKSFVPLTSDLNTNQRDALISFSFNVGPGNLKKLCAGRTLKEIAEHILDFNHAGGKVVAGLTRRREAERKLFKTSVEEEKKASIYKYDDVDANKYTQKYFRHDLQVALKCNNKTGNYTEELLNNTITLTSKKNENHVIVKFLQKYLKYLGCYSGDISKKYDSKTIAAVKKFQKGFLNSPDGEIDAKKSTWIHLIK